MSVIIERQVLGFIDIFMFAPVHWSHCLYNIVQMMMVTPAVLSVVT